MAVLTEEQTMLRDAAREWTKDNAPVGALRKVRDAKEAKGYDPALFAQMAEMGWAGVVIPEGHGGSDFGYLSLGLVLEETGRTLTASPLLSSALAFASALVLGGTEAQKAEWLPQIAAGEKVGALAVDDGPRHAPEKTSTTATRDGDGWVLKGVKSFVPDGMAADLLAVTADKGGGDVGLFLVSTDTGGLSRTRLNTADSRGVARVALDGVRVPADAELKSDAYPGFQLVEAVLDRARAGLAAEMLGMSVQAFETTLDYLKTRVQFGQVIGTFQALQHRAAAMFTEIEITRSAVEAALTAIDTQADNVPELVSLAKLRACETLHLVSNEMVQMHGGIGMTDAHDAGFYLKRARAAEAIWGGLGYHRERFGRLNGY